MTAFRDVVEYQLNQRSARGMRAFDVRRGWALGTVYQPPSRALRQVPQSLLVHTGSAAIGGKMCQTEQIEARRRDAR